MQTYQGYIENGRIIPIDMPAEPNGRRVVITVPESLSTAEEEDTHAESGPKPGTLEYLFRDYDGTSFKTELIDLGAPVGNEKW
ncbi:MAG: hypothetical protein LBI74_04605 [Synergistaceae bacterium]|jgi:hypothetical protein|nr:hypothetical protein [Synergistaceae bacterium]